MKTYLSARKTFYSVALLLAGVFWIWFSRLPISAGFQTSIEAPQNGFQAPGFTLSTLEGKELDLEDLRGNPIILNFWASWCPPCRAEMPDFQQTYQEFQETDLQIIAINATDQDSLKGMMAFVNQHNLKFPIILDSTGETSQAYHVHSLPTSYFIDREGRIKDIIVGGPIPLSLLRIQAIQLIEGNQ
ncbi:MAG: TlpA family protein disulfide reductase [Anaerolineales bacterium]|nr:TlpA family protein disulfide reductase [Anaerolineales bacterium]